MARGNNLRTCYLTERDSQQHRGNTCCHWGKLGRGEEEGGPESWSMAELQLDREKKNLRATMTKEAR